MQLLITLKGIEDLSHHFPADVDPKEIEFKRLWEINEELLEKLISAGHSDLSMEYIFTQLSFDLQCLFKTFEVTVREEGIACRLVDYWKAHESVLLVGND